MSAADGVFGAATALHSTISADAEFFGATIGANTATQTHIQTTGVIATTGGGSVTLNADGGFTYNGAAGFTGLDTFTYTLIDLGLDGAVGGGDDLTGTGTVTFNVQGTVWFIDNSGGGSGGSGTQADPFKSIASFNAVNDNTGLSHPGTGDTIYLREGTGTYSEADGINLLNDQILIGQGENLVINHTVQGNITVETGSVGDTPTIVVTGAGNQAIQLAQNNNIHGLNVGMNNATAVGIADGGGTVGNLTISNVGVGVGSTLGQAIDIDQGGGTLSVALNSVNSSGGVNGIELAGAMTGTFAASNSGTLSGHSGAEVSLSGGSTNFSYGGTIGDGTGDFGPDQQPHRRHGHALGQHQRRRRRRRRHRRFRQRQHHHQFHRRHQDAEHRHRRRRVDDQQHRHIERQLHRRRAGHRHHQRHRLPGQRRRHLQRDRLRQ